MARTGNTLIKEYGKKTRFPAVGTTEKMGTKVYGFRVPMDVQEKLEAMSQKDRIVFLRSLVVDAVRRHQYAEEK